MYICNTSTVCVQLGTNNEEPTTHCGCCSVLRGVATRCLQPARELAFCELSAVNRIDLYSSVYSHTTRTQKSPTHTCTQNISHLYTYRYIYNPRVQAWWSDQKKIPKKVLTVKLNLYVCSPCFCCRVPAANSTNCVCLFSRAMSHLRYYELEKLSRSGALVCELF